jgi:hypothetical protein
MQLVVFYKKISIIYVFNCMLCIVHDFIIMSIACVCCMYRLTVIST